MKNIKNIISFIIMSIVLVSCDDKGIENHDWLQEPNFTNPMTLSLSSNEVVLIKENEDADAITFTWTQGNDRGAGTTLKYFFRIDILGNNFSKDIDDVTKRTVYTEEIPDGVLTKSYTVKQLNSLLLKHFKRPGGAVTNLEVQIIAQVNGGTQFQLPEVSTSSFAATSYSPGPLPLFMVGDAISGSWDYNTGKSLPEITERTLYNFIGDFSVGSFKVIEKPGSELPSYDPVAVNNLVYNETNQRTADNVFKVTESGRHSLYMDIDKGTYIFGYVPYQNVYMVGNAITGIGWDIGKAKQMIWDAKNPEVFSYKGQFDAGEFKLYTQQGDWGGRALMPAINGTKLIPDADAIVMSLMPNANPDNKWVIEATGNYELIVNPSKMTIKLKKL
ncbi:SusF/SusE family outer membrane protein [Flavobacterium sp. W22_SRS_FK3]|uniref:SusF/SusE family outer membrane protein n=1 Tax=Flavobacterium sp. W22_SRS_FK3 TaxID=3240275 RepID=UPI003F926FCE